MSYNIQAKPNVIMVIDKKLCVVFMARSVTSKSTFVFGVCVSNSRDLFGQKENFSRELGFPKDEKQLPFLSGGRKGPPQYLEQPNKCICHKCTIKV